MKIENKINSIIKGISVNVSGGDKFFDEIDSAIKKKDNRDIIIELFDKVYHDFGINYNLVISGGFGDLIMYLIQKQEIKCNGTILQVSGGITSHSNNMNTSKKSKEIRIENLLGDIENKDFIFIDDSYYSGTTKISIDLFLKKFKSKILKTYVVYDGNDKKEKDRFALYNYYDWNKGSKRTFTELSDELYKYSNIPHDSFMKRIVNGEITSIIQLRKCINDFKLKVGDIPNDIYSRVREKISIKRFKNFNI